MLQTSTRSQHGCRASGGYAAVYRGTLLVASSAQMEKADLALCLKK
ncbi:hypothetical protein [Xenorhabdus bovienii]|nr:hypothetical protein [Xenorhabdus bovienii]MDE9534957.1 hypothetical protein [Xenorhabdus bovienii]MDE9586494.1 hypothetical protein [Xenorhabdus bovienii]